jgi:26S proteasome regulatory subunit (ATPase 3-interacting protein)
LVKALATLKENGEINEKVWGKTIIYSAIQECSEDVSELQQELSQLTAKVDDLNQKIKTKTRKLKAEKSLCQLQIELTQARELKSKLENEAKELKQRNIPKETIKIDEKEYSFLMNEWKVKKRLFKNMWDTALEQYEGNIKELKEKLSIETDEDYHMNMKDY